MLGLLRIGEAAKVNSLAVTTDRTAEQELAKKLALVPEEVSSQDCMGSTFIIN